MLLDIYKINTMKNIKKSIFLIALISVFVVQGQEFQGKAYYQTKQNFDIKLDSSNTDDAMQKEIQAMLKKQFEKTYILSFEKTRSLYVEEKQLNKPTPSQGGMVIEIIGNSSEVLYKDTKNNTYVNAQESFGKKFLIKDALKSLDWKIGKETKMIGKYLCIKATAIKMVADFDEERMEMKEKKKEQEVIAWYTPEIAVSNGPSNFYGLPGLILELHEGKMHYVCTKIVLNPKKKIDITAPKKGKIVTEKEFKKIMNKKAKEMHEQFKGGRKKGNDRDHFSIEIRG